MPAPYEASFASNVVDATSRAPPSETRIPPPVPLVSVLLPVKVLSVTVTAAIAVPDVVFDPT